MKHKLLKTDIFRSIALFV